jgi:PTS system nitrogen regulatory IIA component
MNAERAGRSPSSLTAVFPPEAIRVGLRQPTKSAVIAELVRHAVVLGYLPRQEEGPILDAILEREDLGSTALGQGIAWPHCQWQSLRRFVGVAGLLPVGIPGMDGKPLPPTEANAITMS